MLNFRALDDHGSKARGDTDEDLLSGAASDDPEFESIDPEDDARYSSRVKLLSAYC